MIPANNQKGLTLLELIISMSLSLFLIGGMIQIFTGSKQTFLVQKGLANIQENARFTLDIMARDMRMAGFKGCSTDVKIVNVLASTVYAGNMDLPVVGYETSGSSSYLTPTGVNWSDVPSEVRDLVATIPAGNSFSDIITLRRLASSGVGLADEVIDVRLEDKALVVTNLANFQYPEVGEIVYVGDCQNGSIFQVTGIDDPIPTDLSTNITIEHAAGAGTPGNRTGWLFPEDEGSAPIKFGPTAGLYSLGSTSVTYFVAPSAVDNNQCEVTLSLWRMAGDDAPQELIPGIENIEILYGVDSNNDGFANRYTTADNVDLTVTFDADNRPTVADDIVSVRINLTVNSIERIDGNDPVTHEFSQTFQIRNQGA